MGLGVPTTLFSFTFAVVWFSILCIKPSVFYGTQVSTTLHLLSAMLFFLYVSEDPELTSNKRYNKHVQVSGKTVGAVFLTSMALVYLWMNWKLTAGCVSLPQLGK